MEIYWNFNATQVMEVRVVNNKDDIGILLSY